MMSQNRQEEKDRRRAENDYKVNLKTEIMIEDLYDKVNAILAKQSALEKRLQTEDKTAGYRSIGNKTSRLQVKRTCLHKCTCGRRDVAVLFTVHSTIKVQVEAGRVSSPAGAATADCRWLR